MKVYMDDGARPRLVGRAEIDFDEGPVVSVYLFGAASTIREEFAVRDLAGSSGLAERGVVLRPGQRPELLPGWHPLAS